MNKIDISPYDLPTDNQSNQYRLDGSNPYGQAQPQVHTYTPPTNLSVIDSKPKKERIYKSYNALIKHPEIMTKNELSDLNWDRKVMSVTLVLYGLSIPLSILTLF